MWKKKLADDPIPWLLQSQPYTRYRTLMELLEKPIDDPDVMATKQEMLAHEKTQALIAETQNWFPQSVTRHNDAKLTHYKLRMLADFGLNADDPGIAEIIETATAHQQNGLPAIRQTLPNKGEGFRKPDPNAREWHAMPCDSPLLAMTLKDLAYSAPELDTAVEEIAERWSTPQGWFCHFFFVDGQFKKLQIGCPMAGLQALELFSRFPHLQKTDCVHNAYTTLRYHRDCGRSIYYFGRSKKFWALKYPFVWYNALYLADVLTRYEEFLDEELLRELIDWLLASQDEQGRFTPTSMFMTYKGWDFADKKTPSPWMTFLTCRILKRYFSR